MSTFFKTDGAGKHAVVPKTSRRWLAALAAVSMLTIGAAPMAFASSAMAEETPESSETANHTASKVVFDARGGNSSVSVSDELNEDGSYTIPSLTISRDGFTFGGWVATNSGKTINTYKSGDKIPAEVLNKVASDDGTVTLYARWNDGQIHTATFDSNDGAENTHISDFTFANNVVKLPAPGSGLLHGGNNHGIFVGWSLDPETTVEDTSEIAAPGAEVNVKNSDVTFYAVWETTRRGVSYDLAGGVVDDNDWIAPAYGDPTIVAAADPAKAGYVFTGWTAEDGGTIYHVGDTVNTEAGNVVLTAQWAEDDKLVTLVFNENREGATGEYSFKVQSAGGVTTVAPQLEAAGFDAGDDEFKGWALTADAVDGEDLIAPGDSIEVEESTTGTVLSYYARWAAKDDDTDEDNNEGGDTDENNNDSDDTDNDNNNDAEYKNLLKFDANGAEGTVPDDIEFNDTTVLPDSGDLTLDDYEFGGWSLVQYTPGTDVSEDTRIWAAGDAFSATSVEGTLYAVWLNSDNDTDVFKTTLTFDANGGEGDVPADIKFNDKTLLPYGDGLSLDGYELGGWSTTQYEPGTDVSDADDVYAQGDWFEVDSDEVTEVTLYAVWVDESDDDNIDDTDDTDDTDDDDAVTNVSDDTDDTTTSGNLATTGSNAMIPAIMAVVAALIGGGLAIVRKIGIIKLF